MVSHRDVISHIFDLPETPAYLYGVNISDGSNEPVVPWLSVGFSVVPGSVLPPGEVVAPPDSGFEVSGLVSGSGSGTGISALTLTLAPLSDSESPL